MKKGVLGSELSWRVFVDESETDVAELAVQDFSDWFGRLRCLWGLADLPPIELVEAGDDAADLSISISCTNPYFEPSAEIGAVAFSRPANQLVDEPSLRFSRREYLNGSPEKDLLQSFAQDLFRKSELREGQYEILSRILMGRDAVGLLPTGGGKSLTYQLASLLLPGATLYVAPLKSLLQDQYERLKVWRGELSVLNNAVRRALGQPGRPLKLLPRRLRAQVTGNRQRCKHFRASSMR